MAVKFIALVVLIFSIKCEAKEETENSLDRLLSADCENSEPFFIKNEKKRKSYLTADPGTGAVKGWTKTGKASQQWMWSHCDEAIHLVNVATGGCLTQEGSVSEECSNDIIWEHHNDGTLSVSGQAVGFARLYKKKTALAIAKEVKYKGEDKGGVAQDWFRWVFENVE